MDPTLASILAVLAAILSVAGLVVTLTRNKTTDDRELRKLITDTGSACTKALLEAENKIQVQIDTQGARITATETKVGLFWGLVEDLMPKLFAQLNPIYLNDEEQEAYDEYKRVKNKTATPKLRALEGALDRELHTRDDIPSDEFLAAFFMLTAVKSQLVDRGEEVVKSEYNKESAA